MKGNAIRFVLIFASAVALIGTILFCFVWNGVMILNQSSADEYPVKGVDVSAYQGEINWQELSKQNIKFAFIKATEGSSFVDKQFLYNFSEAQKTDLAVGAYHFFSYDSEGATQAKHFINTVKPFDGMLPPVIDLEFYGDKEKNPPSRESVTRELKTMLSILEEHYGQKPIIYATETSYELYLESDYEQYDIWIRNVISEPRLSDEREWVFWQYTNRECIDGYEGMERYIDMNVFSGNEREYHEYISSRSFKYN